MELLELQLGWPEWWLDRPESWLGLSWVCSDPMGSCMALLGFALKFLAVEVMLGFPLVVNLQCPEL